MTRYENFMQIAHAYYDAYVSQAKCLGQKPLSYEKWLSTDKSIAPGFDESNVCQNAKCSGQCRDKSGRFVKDTDNTDSLHKAAERVSRVRGPAPEVRAKPLAENKEPEEKFFVFENGKLISGDEAKKYFIEHGLLDKESCPKDEDEDEELDMPSFFKDFFGKGGVSVRDFM